MNKRMADIIDLVCLILYLAITLTIGVRSLYRVAYDSKKSKIVYEDKNATPKYNLTEGFLHENDGSLKEGDLLLMMAIQDYNMPAPSVITYRNLKMDINPGYKEYMNHIIITKLWPLLSSNPVSSYKVVYDYKTNSYIIQNNV